MYCPICKTNKYEPKSDKSYKNVNHYRCEKHKIDLRVFKKESK